MISKIVMQLDKINKCGFTERNHVVERIDRERSAVARNGNKNFLPRGVNRTRGFPRYEIRRRPRDKETTRRDVKGKREKKREGKRMMGRERTGEGIGCAESDGEGRRGEDDGKRGS